MPPEVRTPFHTPAPPRGSYPLLAHLATKLKCIVDTVGLFILVNKKNNFTFIAACRVESVGYLVFFIPLLFYCFTVLFIIALSCFGSRGHGVQKVI